MLDHVGIPVGDFGRSKRFYERALSPLGYGPIVAYGDSAAGFGREGKPDFWIARGTAGAPVHVAFTSPDRATVDDFHVAALAAGGRDNGEPGLRPQYHPTYYGAFVLDPDGHNIEAVCHGPGANA